MNIGFALVTGGSFFDDIVSIENELHEYCGFHNKLEKISNIPHTTIFQGGFKDDANYSMILQDIKEFFVSNMSDFQLHFQDVVYVPNGWYFYTCKKTEELNRLHCFTLGRCKDHIILSPDRLNRNLSDMTESQINGVEKYGYRYSGNAFFPHITLGRNDGEMKKEIITSLSDKLALLPTDVDIDRITVYKMGKDGMHSETLDEIKIR